MEHPPYILTLIAKEKTHLVKAFKIWGQGIILKTESYFQVNDIYCEGKVKKFSIIERLTNLSLKNRFWITPTAATAAAEVKKVFLNWYLTGDDYSMLFKMLLDEMSL